MAILNIHDSSADSLAISDLKDTRTLSCCLKQGLNF